MRAHRGTMTVIRAAWPPAAASLLLSGTGSPAQAQAEEGILGLAFNPGDIVLLSALVGVTIFAVWSVIALTRSRQQVETENADLRAQMADLRAAADRAEALIDGEDQRIVVWSAPGVAPLVAGSLPSATGAPLERAGFLAFGTWLKPESAGRLDQAVNQLRQRGDKFTLTVATTRDRLVEAAGRTAGGFALVRFRELTADRLARAEIEAAYQLLTAEVDAMRAMLSTAPLPVWLRDPGGRLAWVNDAFAAAVEANSASDAVDRELELLDGNDRQSIAAVHGSTAVCCRRLSAVVAGNRRLFDVVDVASDSGSAGIAVDVTAVEQAEAAFRRQIDFNARTLDQLTTAVAVFDADRRLVSYNGAYRLLFEFDAAFLESRPDEDTVFERMRAARKLPEQADFRTWRSELNSVYRSADASERWWHLPDGQTLRVIANPDPQGGMTWVYENVTERLELESRHNALIRVQGETLDHLSEGVVVFGSDGRLRLNNPAFAAMWQLDDDRLALRPHISDVAAACRHIGDGDGIWARFTAAIAGFDESRRAVAGRTERADGTAIEFSTVPLPDGQTMVTFVDVTDSVKVARALTERNEALEAADALKNDFIQHVSYELRSPLTNIIGFSQLMSDTRFGSLNDKQNEYMGYIAASSTALLAIVNDILDLATVDAGIMELDLSEVDVTNTVEAVIDGVQDRIAESKIEIDKQIQSDIGTFIADGNRVRQILFNIVTNAIAFSPKGGRVSITAIRAGDRIEFAVTDSGPGIAAEFIDAVFDRFASWPRGEARGGAGLGLSIVKSFATLHGGDVDIRSEEGRGATVTCRFPIRPDIAAAAE